MADNVLSPSAAAAQRLRLSRILAAVGIVLTLVTYTFGSLITYRAKSEDELNPSYRPYSWLAFDEKAQNPTVGDTIKAYLGGYHSLPVWRVTLEAPQYPKVAYPDGITVYFDLTHFTGEVQEMNTLNHYIGMEPMEVAARDVRQAIPWVYALFLVSLIVFALYDGLGYWVFALGPGLMPVYFFSLLIYWFYGLGNRLHGGAFMIKSYMPAPVGEGHIMAIKSHSYPSWGFYLMAAELIVLAIAILIRRRALRELSRERIAEAPIPAAS